VEIYEVKLDGELLMSSLLTESERRLADLAVSTVERDSFDVLVGGLGLGYTARAALSHDPVRTVTVVERLPEVIEWHERGLGPLGTTLREDPRCRFLAGDFFRLLRDPQGLGLTPPLEGYGAILVDIDHAPDSWLHPDHEGFYGPAGLAGIPQLLLDGGVFGFWSSGERDPRFEDSLAAVFQDVESQEIRVYNPLVDAGQVDTVYLARKAPSSGEKPG
jgi:spermidine synthase